MNEGVKKEYCYTLWSEKLEVFKKIIKGESLTPEEEKAKEIASSFPGILAKMVKCKNHKFVDVFSEKGFPYKEINEEDLENCFKLLEDIKDDKLKFLFLWRFLPDFIPEIERIPENEKVPVHSLYDIAVQTASIISSFPKPAILIFTIGPVQKFIAKARRTYDLWAGSYLLSYLIWKSMLPIVENLGPDAVIFPNLRKQPLVDYWLKEKFKNLYFALLHLNTENISISNFPNRFMAIIPEGKELPKLCEEAFWNTIKSIAERVYRRVEEFSNNPKLKEDILSQLLAHFQIYWVILPWSTGDPCSPKDVIRDYIRLFKKTEIYKLVKDLGKLTGNLNTGGVYPLIVELAEKLLGARKSVRDFTPLKQDGEKCHLCGEYDVLWFYSSEKKWRDEKGNSYWSKEKKENDKKWNELAERFPGKIKEGERLCGICLTKRFFPDIFKEEFGKEVKFPSTSEVASTAEKLSLDCEVKKEFKEKFKEKVKDKCDKLPPQVYPVPALQKDELSDIDGEFLMEETYRREAFENLGCKYEREEMEETLKEFREFLRSKNINPSRYYALIQMDGDNMGKWLMGEFNAQLKRIIKDEVDKELLEKKLPMTPSLHRMFSGKLSRFALEKVPKIVEEKYYGKLVYAGGDDVLALLPVDTVIPCTYELQKSFKEVLSPKASMSAGILIVHHKYPLYLALAEVNDAEKKAKNTTNKNAFCIKFLTHSGNLKETVGSWKIAPFITELIVKIKENQFPDRLPYEFAKVVEELGNNQAIKEILKLELKRLYYRKEEVDNEFFENKVLKVFDEEDITPEDFANLLLIARAIAKESRQNLLQKVVI